MGAIQCRLLVGRDAELETLSATLDHAGHDTGLVFLAGEPGVGKSRLAREVGVHAEARGFTVARGRAVQASNPVPLRPIIEALAGIARTTSIPDVPGMSGYRPALAAIVPTWSEPGRCPAEFSPLILGEALLRLLTSLDGKGALLVLEDLHFADPETLAIVEYFADNLAGQPVVCLGTLRDTTPSPAMDIVRSLHARRAAEVITVPRLPEPAVLQMATACLGGGEVSDQAVRQLLANCDGLPFAVEELLASAVASGELVGGPDGWQANETVTTPVPTSIAESVRQRLAALGPDSAEVIVAAAVLGRQFDWTLLPGMTGVSEPDVLSALHGACAAQLLEPPCGGQALFRFRHCLTRDAIVSSLLPPLRARHAARAAAAIEAAHPDTPGGWCELAAELHEAAGHPARAAALLLEAGRRSLHSGALTSAAASLTRAREVLSRTGPAKLPMLADIDETLTLVHTLSGNCDRLMPVAERLLGELDQVAATPARKALVCLRIALALSEADRADLAVERVAQALELARGADDPSLGGWATAVAARCAIDVGDADRALDLASEALASAEASMLKGCSAEAACEALAVIGRRERVRDTAKATAAFERARQISADHGLVVRRIGAMHELGTIEMLEEGGSGVLAEARRLALECGAVSTAAVLDLQLANALSLDADLGSALDAALSSQRSARRLRMRRVEAMAFAAQACILATLGEPDAAESAAVRAQQIAPGDPSVLITTWGEARVTAGIVGNDVGAALAASRTGIGHGRRDRLTAPSMAWGYWPLLSVVAGADGAGALAEARAAGAEVAFWNRGCMAYADAVLAGRQGQRDLADELAEQGRGHFERCAPWWNHVMHRLVATAALRDGWGQPAAWLRQAIGELDERGLHQAASACRGILRQSGERVPRSGRGSAKVPQQLRRLGVTSREMDVFVMVGQGRSNAEIAARLVISSKTVETHVASLAAKAGLAGRRELVAYAARAAAPG